MSAEINKGSQVYKNEGHIVNNFIGEGGVSTIDPELIDSLPPTDLVSPIIFLRMVQQPQWQSLLRRGEYDCQRAFNRRASRKFEGTTKWILEKRAFKDWLHGEGPRCLWLSGKIGCGKSIITTTVIDAVIDQSQKDGKPTLHFFYDHSFKRFLTANTLFESYIKQLLGYIERSGRTCPPSIISRLWDFYGYENGRPDTKELLKELLIPLLKMFPGTTLVVDGLDQCSQQDTLEVVSAFREILKSTFSTAFVSYQEELHIQGDMKIFVQEEIDKMQGDRPISDNLDVLDTIKDRLLSGADGMFLWVQYQIAMLWEECQGDDASDEAVITILGQLPKQLKDIYHRCLMRVNRNEKRELLSKRVLRLICVSAEPFKISELQEALSVNPDTGELGSSPIQKHEILTCCANLAICDREDTQELIFLTHYSVRQFLLTSRGYVTAEAELGKLCVVHLYRRRPQKEMELHSHTPSQLPILLPGSILPRDIKQLSILRPFLRPTPPPVRLSFPLTRKKEPGRSYEEFLSYSMRNWLFLTKKVLSASGCWGEGEKPRATRWWKQFEELTIKWQNWDIYPWHMSYHSPLAHVAAVYGWSILNSHFPMLAIAIGQKQKGKESIFMVPIFENDGERAIMPLQAAVEVGDAAIVKFLLHEGQLPVNAPGDYSLHGASSKGYCIIVQMLLHYDFDVHKQNNTGQTALHLAAENGHEATVDLLLDNKADVHKQNHTGQTALHLAAANGHEAIVYSLLYNKADVHQQDNTGHTALHLAAANGHETIVRVLLSRNADIRKPSNTGQTALHYAAENGYGATVHILLRCKANVHKQDNTGQTALHLAAANGHETIVRLLLDNKANVLNHNRAGYTALDLAKALYPAAANGHKGIVRLLLDSQANIKLERVEHMNRWALYLAAENGHEGTVRLLLDSQANIKVEGYTMNSALNKAAQNGHEGIVRLLLDNQAHIELEKLEDTMSSAILRATENGHETIVELLQKREEHFTVVQR
ncbi:hypothetical protein FE257_001741 [Aspergillus nanangensis]|uniref:Nephrocystin 3-like N-terminal domain-containing protein n=1 Tax=Aspergillus nanangensis TaxID=2582783 RepID=A0AAD4CDJ3_ASPNN|nr:hypothetical protein FE257_001741 [Aspergillus nanangensis]